MKVSHQIIKTAKAIELSKAIYRAIDAKTSDSLIAQKSTSAKCILCIISQSHWFISHISHI